MGRVPIIKLFLLHFIIGSCDLLSALNHAKEEKNVKKSKAFCISDGSHLYQELEMSLQTPV